jgi:hypothetical protein
MDFEKLRSTHFFLDLDSEASYVARVVAENENGIRGEESGNIDIKTLRKLILFSKIIFRNFQNMEGDF